MMMATMKGMMMLKRMMGMKKKMMKMMIGGRSLEGILHKSFRENKMDRRKALNCFTLVAQQVKRAQHLRSHACACGQRASH